MDTVTITIATRDDAASIRSVQHDVWLDTYPNDAFGISQQYITQRVSEYLQPESIQKLQDMMLDEHMRTWVAKAGTEVVGYCTAEKSSDSNQIRAMYVLPAYHGKAVGSELIERALDWLGQTKQIAVEVAVYNDRAIRFYEKNGFKKNGVFGNSDAIPTTELVRPAKN